MTDRLVTQLKDLREVHGLTQAQLGQMIGVSRKTINTVENGVYVPSTVIALKLAAALGVSVEVLFSLTE